MPNTRVPISILLIVLGLACIHICKCSGGHVIGRCDEGHSCSECYQTLVRSLLSKDQNLFNLSKAFFPTNSNDRPQFVTVTYRFKDTNETKVWYWSEKGSFFVYPLQTFEYLSLFFGKASAFFIGNVTVTLDQECQHAELFMQHLTQRVSNVMYFVFVDLFWSWPLLFWVECPSYDSRGSLILMLSFHIRVLTTWCNVCSKTCRKPIK